MDYTRCYYSLSDLNLWLQQQFVLNKIYCTIYSNNSNLTFGNVSPAQNMNYLSNICPVVSPVFSIYLGCNLIVSEFNQIGNLFSQFPISAS